jgi:hypothetical protein
MLCICLLLPCSTLPIPTHSPLLHMNGKNRIMCQKLSRYHVSKQAPGTCVLSARHCGCVVCVLWMQSDVTAPRLNILPAWTHVSSAKSSI